MLIDELGKFRKTAVDEGIISPSRLAAAFGWDEARVRERHITLGTRSLDVARGYSGVQPAALFATAAGASSPDAIDLAAIYGYHASVRWGLMADETGLTPFNSHWLQRDRWFEMPTVEWNKLDEQIELLEAFQPRQLIEGAPDRIALDRFASPTLLQPVDDELVERLDAWRDQALKTSRSDSGVDDQLQTLFAKLFVLRTIEDRHLAEGVPALSKALRGSDGIDQGQLIDTFDKARRFIGSELFDSINLNLIPEHVISGVISPSYSPAASSAV